MRKTWKQISAFLLAMLLTVSLGTAAAFASESEAKSGPLGIISAMDVELQKLVEEAEITKEETVSGSTFYTGTLHGVDVVLVRAGIGKVLATSCTQTLINNYRVGGVVFTGIAGGVGDDVNVMDMVIGTGLVQHDYGTETNDGFEWNGKAAEDAETGMIPVDEALSNLAYASACKVLGEEKVHQGVIATGDQFISSESYVKELQDKFNALACEMEGAAVARVCDQYNVPCAVLRCMSDKADGIAHDTYAFNYTEASNTSADVVMGMMDAIAAAGQSFPAAKVEVQKDTTPRTAIISAMSVELDALVKAAKVEKEVSFGGKTFYLGTLNGENVVMVQAGIGKVMAAGGTAALLNNFNVKNVVFTGIAGGVGDDVNVMDMVIGTGLVQHDYGTETNDGFEWNGEAAANKDTGIIPVSEALSKIAYTSACEVLGEKKVHQGVIATGDQFISSESYVKALQDNFKALACEMEGAAVARVCDQYSIPCAVLRCMSDKADGIAHDTYAFNYTEASNTSASVVMNMMTALSSQTGDSEDALPFEDVAETDWFYDAVKTVYANDLMGAASDNAFSPYAKATRGMLTTILWRLEGSPKAEADVSFSDVADGAYYADAVHWAAGKGIVSGGTDGRFSPDQPITREQMAAILYRYAQSKDKTIAEGNYAELDFTDTRAVSEYAYEALCWCAAERIITGNDGVLDPQGTANRAQIAVILVRITAQAA
jgi:adenosylhomocysteine nucleosidase